jgi:phosphohistidine phosphatase SixA
VVDKTSAVLAKGGESGRTACPGVACLFGVMLALGLPAASAAESTDALWRSLKGGGHVVLLRHALAPGTGDPAEFKLSDCATQRNLSAEGRDQAVRIGDQFRANGITDALVYTSEWCRCRDTAQLLELGKVEPLPVINSFFRNFSRREGQTEGLRDWLSGQPLDRAVVLVTHQVNITALTGIYPRSGEGVVIAMDDGEVSVLGSLPAP